jgi:tetratricopeptide (TPR) repeat protein
LQVRPNDARALFYKANIRRIQGKIEEAIELYQQALAQYPRFADGYRELGFTYYQQKKYDLARTAYESLQGVDPDDLSAHYNLMLIYRRLGLKEKAAEQAAYFSDRKDDPAAASVALDWLRANPQISNESVPWHVHMANGIAPDKNGGEQ